MTLLDAPPPAPAPKPSGTPPARLPSAFNDIIERLDHVGARFRLAAVIRGLAKFLLIVLPITTLGLFLTGYFSLPTWLNIAMLALLIATWVIGYIAHVHRPVFHRPTYAEIARLIEQNAAQTGIPLNNELINAVLLANDFENAETKSAKGTAWIPQVLRSIQARTHELPLENAVQWNRVRNITFAALGIVILCGAIIASMRTTFAHGLAVLGRPNSFVPVEGTIRILNVQPGNDTVLAGQSLNFLVTVDSPQKKLVDARLAITFKSGKSTTLPMTPFGSDNSQYRYQLAAAAEDLDYVITVGDTQSDRYHIAVLPQIHLTSLNLEATPPPYTGRDKTVIAMTGKDATATRGSLEVPAGSMLNISATLDIPVREVLADIAGSQPLTLASSADDKLFTTSMLLTNSFKYALRINDNQRRTLRRFPDSSAQSSALSPEDSFTITATPDEPPTIAVTNPAKDTDAMPGNQLPLSAQAADDYGLTQISLEIAKNDDKEFHQLKSWPIPPAKDGKPSRAATINHTLDLPATDYKLGDTLRYRFVATDNRDLKSLDPAMGPQSTPGQVFTITFNDTAAAAAKSSKLWDELRTQLTKLLEKQVALRKSAADLTATITLPQVQKITAPISDGQKSLRTDMTALAKDFPFEPSMKLVQKSLQVLAIEDATSAVDRSADILLLSDTQQKSLTPLATKLRQHQSRIIDVLQSLLAIANSDENHIAKEGDNEGADLPNDPKDAWKKLSEDLKEFEKDQKAVIDASADLAKKPKDEYDQNDQKKIADLKAVEDKWEKFLNNRLVDMSKIAEQDQANASLLDEMVQMKVELAAAANALDQKATQIATPLEENGLENAKALDTHIERMLMQTPDHTQWQMEEPVTQNDPAMAELPTQLQDMIGDLMDKQEDLTDDMESTASKFADSLNKGAGWDAADGPISNMSAQGVTGNQMPKNMEIQGRSGEGREGRSSGEFVGQSAEGKGGRETPTRMTNDPFSSGQVQDKSQQPAGGATGGGKKGGFGGEGLEGQAPDDDRNITQRLQGQQAQLRNQSERLSLQMHAAGFNNFKLIEANVLMKKSEDALKQYNYQTALYYQQQAVQSLNTAKVLASGQVHVIADTSPTATEKSQKDVENALNGAGGALPKGYSDPVKAYFQKLSNTDN
ncbi:MAG TPA: DUF4175 family protein [Phycisphaerae bacterium]|nr:DUF4175 family protein [Phycisphaerae bacterium]